MYQAQAKRSMLTKLSIQHSRRATACILRINPMSDRLQLPSRLANVFATRGFVHSVALRILEHKASGLPEWK